MATLLKINSSPSPMSVSRELTAEFVASWRAAHPEGTVIERDLNAAPQPPIDAAWIGAAYTDPATRTAEQNQALAISEELLGELERADEYVIGVAMHNFSIPSVLKLWIDQIARRGRTFTYGEEGPIGLLKGKKATVIVATGGDYGEGSPAAAMNFIHPYLRAILGFFGVTDVRFITAGGMSNLRIPGADRRSLLQPAIEEIRALAA